MKIQANDSVGGGYIEVTDLGGQRILVDFYGKESNATFGFAITRHDAKLLISELLKSI